MLASSTSVFSQTSPSVFGDRTNAFSPTALDGLALWVDASDQNSLLASDGSVIEDGEAVALWSDKSGNSAENCLVLNGTTGNYASSPKSAAVSAPSVLDVVVDFSVSNPSAGATQLLVGQYGATGNQRSWYFGLSSTGKMRFSRSQDGTGPATTDSVASWPYAAYVRAQGRMTWDSTTGDVSFYYRASSSASWTLLETQAGVITGAAFNSTANLTIGADANSSFGFVGGRVYKASFSKTIGGAYVFDADFTAQNKLDTSFTESSSNALTITINTSGATGARISGARDPYQGTVANRGTYSSSEKSVTTDGSNDYLKAATFSQTQPVTLYAAMQQVTWTSGDYLFDGNSANTLALIQTTSTPQLNISAGSSVAANTDLAVATKGVVSMVINGASSSLRIDRDAETTGNAGAGNAYGFTIGAKADGTAPGNGKYYETLVYSGAHDAATRDRIALYLAKKWGIAV